MSLVIRPRLKVGTFKGFDILLQSTADTEDYERFVLAVKELEAVLMEGIS